MEQITNNQLNWRNQDQLETFFRNFYNNLVLCNPANFESNIQNTQYNSTRQMCRSVMNNYLPTIERIVSEIENTQIPIETLNILENNLTLIINHSVFDGIEEEIDIAEHGDANNLWGRGDNQQWSEVDLVGYFDKLDKIRRRVRNYRRNLERNIRGHNEEGDVVEMTEVDGGTRKKYCRKSKKRKMLKNRKISKKRKTSKKKNNKLRRSK